MSPFRLDKSSADTMRTIGALSTIGFAFVLAIVIGFGFGYFLDSRLGTSPWLSMVFFFVGLAAGVLNVFRTMKYVLKNK